MRTAAQLSFVRPGIAYAVALAFGPPAAGQPADPDAPISIRVEYADLNLATAAGASAMLVRMRSAASQACGTEPDIRDLSWTGAYDRCRTETLARALATLNVPLVT